MVSHLRLPTVVTFPFNVGSSSTGVMILDFARPNEVQPFMVLN